ncbi:MAG: heparan-alpha-glucosaminide N-acetyltransferase domain-containing protein [Alloacidobacterium sp.]
MSENPLGEQPAPVPGKRLASIDALRGFDMFWLMQEQCGLILALAAVLHLPWQNVLAKELDHTPWVGFTFWDLIAPLFLFIVGLSLPLALERRRQLGQTTRTIVGHILRRTAILIALGLVFNGILRLDFADFRYTGVLQRIALSYIFAALITLFCKLRGQIAWTIGLLLGYWAIMALIPVPGFGHNVLTPQGNLEGYIDRLFLPGKFCCYVYGDNEGYLSTIPSVATVMLGVLCSHLVHARRSERFKVVALAAGGVSCLGLGLLWGMVFPIITRLWTSSYTVYSNGWCMLLFALFYWVIDVKGWKKWSFWFIVIGLNPLLIYVVQELFDFSQASNILFGGLASHAGLFKVLVLAVGTVATKWLFLYFLHRQKIYLKT